MYCRYSVDAQFDYGVAKITDNSLMNLWTLSGLDLLYPTILHLVAGIMKAS